MNLVNALNLEMSYKLFIHLFNKYFQRDSRDSYILVPDGPSI